MGRMRLCNNADSNMIEGFCIIKSVQIRSNIKGNDYLDLVLADCEGEMIAKLWDYNPIIHGTYAPDNVIKIRGSITVWKEAEQIKVDKIRLATDADPVDLGTLIPCAPFDPEWMYERLYEITETFSDHDLSRLTQYLLKENKAALLRAPAAVKLHHATRGGLLHHTVTLLELAQSVCRIYPALDSDLVYAGVILHDMAKLKELDIGPLGLSNSYTVAGQLMGHISLGIAMIQSAADLLDIPEELCMLIQHMLLSHHGLAEYGSPKPPMFPEAEVLSQLDTLDSKLFEMFDALAGVPAHSFSERIWALDNRQLYQHHHLQLQTRK